MLDSPMPDSDPTHFPQQWHRSSCHTELPTAPGSSPDRDEIRQLPALPVPQLPATPALPSCPSAATSSTATPRPPTRSQAFLAHALEASGGSATVAGALVPWICDALLSNHSVKAYGRDFMDFVRHMQAQGVDPAGGHRRPRQALQARPARGRHDVGHRRPAAVGAPRRLRAARRQGAGLLGDRPGHRRHQGPRRPEERHALADPAAGDRPAGGHPHRHACRASATWR